MRYPASHESVLDAGMLGVSRWWCAVWIALLVFGFHMQMRSWYLALTVLTCWCDATSYGRCSTFYFQKP
eukprot:2199341-Rhodomonas_salina.4